MQVFFKTLILLIKEHTYCFIFRINLTLHAEPD